MNLICRQTIDNVKTTCIYKCNLTNPTFTIQDVHPVVSTFSIINCELTIIPENLWSIFPKLRSLIIENNGVESLDLKLSSAGGNLEKLVINDGIVSSLKDQFCTKCHNLTQLNIYHCNMRKIESTAFEGLDLLQHLDLGYNSIAILKKETFASLKNLKYLFLSFNKIKIIDRDLFLSNRKLQMLQLYHNQISKLEEETFEDLNELNILEVSNNKLVDVMRIKIEILQLRQNYLKTFFVEKKTKLLTIHHNLITNLGCSKNTELSVIFLDAGYNFLESLKCITEMVHLTKLNLEHNKLSYLPAEPFKNLNKLETLNVLQNQLKEFDFAFLASNQNLVFLTISNISSYDNLTKMIPNLTVIELEVKEWNCIYVQQIRLKLELQNISMIPHKFPSNYDNFVCRNKNYFF